MKACNNDWTIQIEYLEQEISVEKVQILEKLREMGELFNIKIVNFILIKI